MKLFKMIVVMVTTFIFGASMMHAENSGMKKGLKMPTDYRTVPFSKAQILQSGKSKMFCSECGMYLPKFYRTNHAATVDGKVEQFCSIYALVELMKTTAKITNIKVVDNITLKFINAKKAFYVVGSSKPATMTSKSSKYAFGTKEAAGAFAKKFGGKVMSFDDALQIAKNDFGGDKETNKIKQAKAAKMGAIIYKKKCKSIEKKFVNVAEAKSYIKVNNVCTNIKSKELQAVGLYLLGK